MHLKKLQNKNVINHPRELKCYGDKEGSGQRKGLHRRGSLGLGKKSRKQACGNGFGLQTWELTGTKAGKFRTGLEK